MAEPCLPPIEAFHALPRTAQAHALDLLFEPSPALHDVLANSLSITPFASYNALVDHTHTELLKLATAEEETRATLRAILGSHPRLGARRVESAQSVAEQAKLQAGAEEERAELASLNDEYEAKFPGLRYVVFVNGRGTPETMADMRRRIATGDAAGEERTAIQAMCDIAKDRAAKILAR